MPTPPTSPPSIWDYLNPIDCDALSREYHSAEPFPFFSIPRLLRADFAREVLSAYPSYERALEMGREFGAANEMLKVQITEPGRFPEPVRKLHEILSSEEFIRMVGEVTGIDGLVADPALVGAGMHVMGSGGRLDVHVDFNRIKDRDLYRRLNILVFLNERWEADWGGRLELWDEDVKECQHSIVPEANRCVVFETSEHSFHGVTPLSQPQGFTRNSFAGYYYTNAAPAEAGDDHSTVFRPRPNERLRWWTLVPAERFMRALPNRLRSIKRAVFGAGR